MTDHAATWAAVADARRADVLDDLRALPPEERTRAKLKDAADALDITVADVRRAIGNGTTKDNTQGEAVILQDVEPWPEPVDGLVLCESIAAAIDRHLHVDDHHRDVITLWAIHAHLFVRFQHSPRLGFTGPSRNCGKSTAMLFLSYLVNKPVMADNLTPAVFFRFAAAQKPTFLIDEVDAWLREDSNLPGALNGGFERNGGVMRCEGDAHEVRRFSTFTPTVLAGIQLDRKLPPATLSRTLVVTMERATAGEIPEPFDYRRHGEAIRRLARKAARWAMDHAAEIEAIDPSLPSGTINRDADRWRPLAAVAKLIGGDWPERVERAIFHEGGGAEPEAGELLLRAIATVLESHPDRYGNAIWTADLIERLSEMDDDRWSNYNFKAFKDDDKPIKPRQIAALLKPYGIRPQDIRIRDIVQKGYRRRDLDRVLARYLPATSATTLQASNDAGFQPKLSATASDRVADRNAGNPAKTGQCSGVADTEGGSPKCPHCDDEGCAWCAAATTTKR